MLDERLYRSLYRIRRIEEEVARVYPTDVIMSPIHLSIGQEAISVGICDALGPEDVVFGSYRSHALFLAKGGDLRRMIAELYGKATGVAKGKAGSMHLLDPDAGVMGASAVVATTIPHAVGYALGVKMRREPRVVVSFFGDGAVEEGVFHESLNFAQLRRVPVLFVCENNHYAIHSRQRTRQASVDICRLAAAHGIEAHRFDNPDVVQLRAHTLEAVESLRRGECGPIFFECTCYRWREHVGPNDDFAAGYRSRAEAEPWFESDQMAVVGRRLAAAPRKRIEDEVEAEIADAFRFAEQSPFPDESELYTDMYQ
ncbi:MAG TPA: thiamine pyrophosphate-dependent dehydrogenase E1 component subunit alpha [Pirellulales bacterium]|nr:thiamine pyrophosphate-dependent dehydrogenase E1 component subunit alpha [Pirellulales bacterium]